MLPRWHIFFGAIFTFIIWISAPQTPIIFLLLMFSSSFLIDFDHYIVSVRQTKKLSLKNSFEYHKEELKKEDRDIARGIRRKGDFHIFHTVEFHALVGVLAIFFSPFLYIFMGMVFHSLLDVFSLVKSGKFHRREYFFFEWRGKSLKGVDLSNSRIGYKYKN